MAGWEYVLHTYYMHPYPDHGRWEFAHPSLSVSSMHEDGCAYWEEGVRAPFCRWQMVWGWVVGTNARERRGSHVVIQKGAPKSSGGLD